MKRYKLESGKGASPLYAQIKDILLSNIEEGIYKDKIPTEKLFGEQKKIADYINHIAEGLDAAFESSHRSAHCVEAGSYHHERRARRCVDGLADALPRCGVCRLAGNAGPAFRSPAEDRSRHERLRP